MNQVKDHPGQKDSASCRPLRRLCRWCTSPWWTHASSGRPPWRTGHASPCWRTGPARLPGRRPAAACWRARTWRRGLTSHLACHWLARLPARTETRETLTLLFVSINGAVVAAAELDGTKLSHHLTIVNFLQVHHGEAEKSLFTVLIQNGYKKSAILHSSSGRALGQTTEKSPSNHGQKSS